MSARDIVLEQRRRRLMEPQPHQPVLSVNAENSPKWVKQNSAQLAQLYSKTSSPASARILSFEETSCVAESDQDDTPTQTPSDFDEFFKQSEPVSFGLDSDFIQEATDFPVIVKTEAQPTSDLEIQEARRQFHLACEQNRRKNIKDGLEELKNQIPNCENQKLTKTVILSKAISYVQHLKRQKYTMTQEIAKLREQLQQFRSSCTCGAAENCGMNHDAPFFDSSQFFFSNSMRHPHQQEHFQEYCRIQPKFTLVTPNSSTMTSVTLTPAAPMETSSTSALTVPPNQPQQPTSVSTLQASNSTFPSASSTSSNSQDMSWLDAFRPRKSTVPSSSLPEDQLPLPAGWERITTPDNKALYVNNQNQTSSWVHPGLQLIPKSTLSQPLPEGWDMSYTSEGLPFFIDHVNKRTTWIDPRPGAWTADNIPSIAVQSSLMPSGPSIHTTNQLTPCKTTKNPDDDEGYHSQHSSLHSSDTAFLETIPSYGALYVN